MFRIRFHGRGGQGMKTASRVLGTAFFREGFEVQDAPRYGAERRGAPIFAYVRAARVPIQERGIIARPDLVIVADETLLPIPAAGVLQGVAPETVILLNSAAPVESWRNRLGVRGPIVTLPVVRGSRDEAAPQGLPAGAPERAELSFVGTICAGAAARLAGVVSRDSVGHAIRDELADLGADVIERNLQQALGAYDAAAVHEGLVKEGAEPAARGYAPPQWIDVPFEAARVSAPDIFAAATSVEVRTGLWRTLRPVIDYEHCNRCSWVCSTLCPDSAIRVEADQTPRIDYDHCKGCMICVAVCPPHAIRAVPEHEAQREEAAR